MNNLDRDIEKGEVVILKQSDYPNTDDWRFVCEFGFGLHSFTRGSAIAGYFVSDNEHCRIEGYEIDRIATEKYQAENGKFLKPESNIIQEVKEEWIPENECNN